MLGIGTIAAVCGGHDPSRWAETCPPWRGMARWPVWCCRWPAWAVPPTNRSPTGYTTVARFTKLIAEIVREALVALNLRGLREPGQLRFVHPGVHRDGPGWLARVNLPAGMEAVKVIANRDGLSSVLRLPVDQVSPAPGPD